jgi:hypothetical protein
MSGPLPLVAFGTYVPGRTCYFAGLTEPRAEQAGTILVP